MKGEPLTHKEWGLMMVSEPTRHLLEGDLWGSSSTLWRPGPPIQEDWGPHPLPAGAGIRPGAASYPGQAALENDE